MRLTPWTVPAGLPPLTPGAAAQVEQMVALLRQRLEKAGGSISFAEYMETALFAPGLGYYSGGGPDFGERGDFLTAPELSPLFGRCLARQVLEVLNTLGPGAEILEVGAGSGVLAAGILKTLEERGAGAFNYSILELSSGLRAKQLATLKAEVPNQFNQVRWLSDLPPHPWSGVLIANELLDAMPVQRFALTANSVAECRVTWDGSKFAWHNADPDYELRQLLMAWKGRYGREHSSGYTSELGLTAEAWIRTLAERLERGVAIFIDYGYPGWEYYHTLRDEGTLACHYRHRRHYDPLILPGQQDITSHVNFTALTESALAAGLELVGYTTQAYFLLGAGISGDLDHLWSSDQRQQLELANQVRILTLPQEMGETFKVLGLARNWKGTLSGFQLLDLRDRLDLRD